VCSVALVVIQTRIQSKLYSEKWKEQKQCGIVNDEC
jgi:hypothetical protein